MLNAKVFIKTSATEENCLIYALIDEIIKWKFDRGLQNSSRNRNISSPLLPDKHKQN